MYKALADPAHPFAKFTTGNKATLGQNGTLGLLRELYHRRYARGPAPSLRGGGGLKVLVVRQRHTKIAPIPAPKK